MGPGRNLWRRLCALYPCRFTQVSRCPAATARFGGTQSAPTFTGTWIRRADHAFRIIGDIFDVDPA